MKISRCLLKMCYKTKSDSCLRKSIKIRTYEKPVKTSSAVAAVKAVLCN